MCLSPSPGSWLTRNPLTPVATERSERSFVVRLREVSSPFVLRSGGGTWPPGLAACASARLRHPDFLQRQKVGAGHSRTVTVVLGPALASLIESERGRERPGEGEKPKRG